MLLICSLLMADRGKFASRVRNFTFGVEDSLVSTVGLLSGVAAAEISRESIIITGIVLIFVEALSMGIGSVLSEHAAEEFVRNKEVPLKNSLLNGLIMFSSYFAAGFVPLSPYIFTEVSNAFWISIAFSIAALFCLGAVGAYVLKIGIIKHGMQMSAIGGAAIIAGVAVGSIVHYSL